MKVTYMILKDGISIQSTESKSEAEFLVKEWAEYHADGRKYVIEDRKQAETLRDIESICGIASKDRILTVNGKPFTIQKNGDIINLIERS